MRQGRREVPYSKNKLYQMKNYTSDDLFNQFCITLIHTAAYDIHYFNNRTYVTRPSIPYVSRSNMHDTGRQCNTIAAFPIS